MRTRLTIVTSVALKWLLTGDSGQIYSSASVCLKFSFRDRVHFVSFACRCDAARWLQPQSESGKSKRNLVLCLEPMEFAAFICAESKRGISVWVQNLFSFLVSLFVSIPFAALQLSHFIGWLPTVDVSYQHLCLLQNVFWTSLRTNITLILIFLIFLLHLRSSMFSTLQLWHLLSLFVASGAWRA